jgi:integrase
MTDLVPLDQQPLVSARCVSPDLLAGQLAPSSIEKYRQDFAAFAAFAGGEGHTPQALARWRAHLAESTTYSPHTINRMLAAVKRVMKEAAAQGYIGHDQAAAFARVEGVKPRALRDRLKQHSRTRIAPSDMRRLCEAPDRASLLGARDAALLATLASSGLRCDEAATLTVGQIEKRGKGYIVAVQGKTDTVPRDAPLSAEAHSLILEWLDKRPIMTTHIFTSFAGRGDRANDRPMSGTSVWRTVQRYAGAVGLAHIKPHDFRRFVGTQLAARDIRKAQKALGHKNINTTAAHYVLDELESGLTDGLY